MNRLLLLVAASLMLLAPVTRASAQAEQNRKTIVGVTPEQVQWFTPPYYTGTGRERAQLFGDSNGDGAWIDRIKIPGGRRVLAHTHPRDELITVIHGTWYLGAGERFDPAKLKGYPPGSFIVIPAGVAHFVATNDGPVIIQMSGTGKWGIDYLEK